MEFIRLASAGVLGGGMLPVLGGCATWRYVDYHLEGDTLKVGREVFQEDEVFVLLRNPQGSSPIYLRRQSNGDYYALLLECTHKQCTVNPSANQLACPCHGSRYETDGVVVEGPARKDLLSYHVFTDSDFIYIELSNSDSS